MREIPEYVLVPARVAMPVPALVRATVALPSLSVPVKLVVVLLPPVVSVIEPAAVLVTVPAPASDPIVSEKPARSTVAPDATVTALLGPMPLAIASLTVPLLTAVAPV